MIDKNQRIDEIFRKLLGSSKMEMAFSNLEDEIMREIEQLDLQKEAVKQGYKKGLQFAGAFFLIGLVCGIILTSLIPKLEFSLPGIDNSLMLIFFQAAFSITVLLFLEKLYLNWKKLKDLQ